MQTSRRRIDRRRRPHDQLATEGEAVVPGGAGEFAQRGQHTGAGRRIERSRPQSDSTSERAPGEVERPTRGAQRQINSVSRVVRASSIPA